MPVSHCDVQWQSGANDCGLFAIAFATAICAGQNPATKVFDQGKMRGHLMQCFHNGRITPFPEHSRKRVMKKPNQEVLPIFCTFRLPDEGDTMVQYKCKEWFHPRCV